MNILSKRLSRILKHIKNKIQRCVKCTMCVFSDFLPVLTSLCSCSNQMISLMLVNVHLPLQRSLQTVLKTGTVTEKSKNLILSKWKPLSELLESFVTRCQLVGNNWDELGAKVRIFILNFVILQQTHISLS